MFSLIIYNTKTYLLRSKQLFFSINTCTQLKHDQCKGFQKYKNFYIKSILKDMNEFFSWARTACCDTETEPSLLLQSKLRALLTWWLHPSMCPRKWEKKGHCVRTQLPTCWNFHKRQSHRKRRAEFGKMEKNGRALNVREESSGKEECGGFTSCWKNLAAPAALTFI